MAERAGAALPDGLTRRADHHVTVLGLEALVRRVLTMPRAHAHRLDVVGQPARAGPGREGDRGFEQRALERPARSGRPALVQRGPHALGRAHACTEITDGQADRRRWSIGLAGHVHDAAHALGDQVESALLPIRTVGAETGELRVDQPRVEPAQGFPAESGAVHHGRPIVLHQHVYRGDQLEEDLAAALALVVQRQALLVAVDVAEVRVALGAVAHGARRIALAGALDVAHLGP